MTDTYFIDYDDYLAMTMTMMRTTTMVMMTSNNDDYGDAMSSVLQRVKTHIKT